MDKKTKALRTTSGLFQSGIRVVGSNDSSILFLILILSGWEVQSGIGRMESRNDGRHRKLIGEGQIPTTPDGGAYGLSKSVACVFSPFL